MKLYCYCVTIEDGTDIETSKGVYLSEDLNTAWEQIQNLFCRANRRKVISIELSETTLNKLGITKEEQIS